MINTCKNACSAYFDYGFLSKKNLMINLFFQWYGECSCLLDQVSLCNVVKWCPNPHVMYSWGGYSWYKVISFEDIKLLIYIIYRFKASKAVFKWTTLFSFSFCNISWIGKIFAIYIFGKGHSWGGILDINNKKTIPPNEWNI